MNSLIWYHYLITAPKTVTFFANMAGIRGFRKYFSPLNIDKLVYVQLIQTIYMNFTLLSHWSYSTSSVELFNRIKAIKPDPKSNGEFVTLDLTQHHEHDLIMADDSYGVMRLRSHHPKCQFHGPILLLPPPPYIVPHIIMKPGLCIFKNSSDKGLLPRQILI